MKPGIKSWHEASNEQNIATEQIECRHHQSWNFIRTWRFHFGSQSQDPCLYRNRPGRYMHGLTPPQVAR